MPRAVGESVPPCPHGYWEHSQLNRCPWCHGRDAHNAEAVPVASGPGNGWLLKRGDPICVGCGGPGCAGWGLLPSGAESWTPEQHHEYRQSQVLCYGCSVNGLRMPIREVERHSPAPGMKGVRVVESGGETYWQCETCWRWGRPRWAHACGSGGNWHKTVRELEEGASRGVAPARVFATAPVITQPLPFEPGNEQF